MAINYQDNLIDLATGSEIEEFNVYTCNSPSKQK
jgi:hypothetical protein